MRLTPLPSFKLSKKGDIPMSEAVIILNVAPVDREIVIKEPKMRLDMLVLRRAIYQTALEKCNGNISAAARLIGIDRRTMQRNITWKWHPSGKKMDGSRPGARPPYGTAKKERELYELRR